MALDHFALLLLAAVVLVFFYEMVAIHDTIELILPFVNGSHPHSRIGRTYFATATMVAEVCGPVIEGPVMPTEHVK